MCIFYNDNEVKGTRPPIPYDKMNANKNFMNHYSNYLILTAIQQNPKDFNEKAQATKELAICERKMEYWKKHVNYEHNVVQKEVEHLKSLWRKK